MEGLVFKILAIEEMQKTEGGVDSSPCKGLSFSCGVGVALSLLTGGIGAILWGPSTVGVCAGAVVSCN